MLFHSLLVLLPALTCSFQVQNSFSTSQQQLPSLFLTTVDENKDANISSSSFCQVKPLQFVLSVAFVCALSCGPQIASAAEADVSPGDVFASWFSGPGRASPSTYAGQGSGGVPFLSPFQTGSGSIPQAPAVDNREARNRAYDEAFDQDKRERDVYYAKMALQAREKRMTEFENSRRELGLDVAGAGPRFGDEPVADMASLKKYLLEKDPSEMTLAEAKELQALQK